MLRIPRVVMLAALLAAGGCASQAQFLNQYEGAALATAQRRAAFELSCTDVNATVLSRKVIQPVAFRGIERAEYTIGVRGCGRQAVYWTMCIDQDNCNALADTGRVEAQRP